MKNFRGPIQRYPGMPQDSSDDEEDDDDEPYYVQPVYFPDEFSDDSDDVNENGFEFNLVFNGEGDMVDGMGTSDPEGEEDDDDDGSSFDIDGDYIPDEEDDSESRLDGDDDSVVEAGGGEELTPPLADEEDLASPAENPRFSPSGSGDEEVKKEYPVRAPSFDLAPENESEMISDEGASSCVSMAVDKCPTETVAVARACPMSYGGLVDKERVENIEVIRKGSPDEEERRPAADSPVEPPKGLLHPDEEAGNNSDDSFEKVPAASYGEVFRSEQNSEAEEIIDEEEQFCNPMASVEDEHTEDILRGDRIGSTTYSERHVLKLLMNWIEKLRQYAKGRSQTEEQEEGGTSRGGTPDNESLDPDSEEAMSLLWDMSAEMDVMHFLMSHNVLALIRDNLDSHHCPPRLKEVALGILANLLSCSSILEEFPDKDEHLGLVERVIVESLTSTHVPILTQMYAVLRRVVCYIRNAKPLDRWMALFLHQDFITAANFLLASSTNVVLLGDVIVTLFTLMEVLSPPHESEDLTEEEKAKNEAILTRSFKPFYTSEFVPSLCEGLNELLKDGRVQDSASSSTLPRRPPTDSVKQPQRGTTGNRPDFEDDLVIPQGHVQNAVLNGVASLSYLQKIEAGKNVLSQSSTSVQSVVVSLLGKFQQYTEFANGPEILDYFAITMELLTLCHSQRAEVDPPALLVPASTTITLISKERENKDDETHVVTLGKEHSSVEIELESSQVSPYSLVFYNYVSALEEKFGKEAIQTIMNGGKEKFRVFYTMIHSVVETVHSKNIASVS